MTQKTARVTKSDAPGAQRTLQDNLVALVWQRLAAVLDDVRIGRAVDIDEGKLICTVEYVKGRKRLQASDENVPLRLYTGGGDVGQYVIPEKKSPVVLVMVDGERPVLLYVARPKVIIWKSSAGLEVRLDASSAKVWLRSLTELIINDGKKHLVLWEKMKAIFNTHTHPADGTTGPPNQQMSTTEKCRRIKVDA